MGNKISQLDKTPVVQDGDLFAVVQSDKYICGKFNTRAVKGSQIMDILISKVLHKNQLCSTAFMLSDEFAAYDHNHDTKYNKLSIELEHVSNSTCSRLSSEWISPYVTFKNVIADDQSLSIGNVFIDGMLAPVEVPLSCISDIQKISFTMVEPKIGALKFVALQSVGSNSSIQYKSDTFDGWMFPDGSTYQLSDFSLSAQLRTLYGNADKKTFTLPCLSSFLKMNGTNQKVQSSAISKVAGKNPLKAHSHTVSIRCDLDAYIRMRMPGNPRQGSSSDKVNKNGTMHIGKGYVKVIGGTSKSIPYNGEMLTFKQFANVMGISINTFSQIMFDDFDKILGEIDKLMSSSMQQQFKQLNTLKLNPLKSVKLSTVMNISDQIDVSYAGELGESVPSHVVLPVMIYVGRRKRAVL